MMDSNKYIFTSERLGFRAWSMEDLPEFSKMNADPLVMEHFPKELSVAESEDFIVRLQNHFEERGYCYFAAEVLETGEWIGFIGLAYQTYESEFSPATDIGWRLKSSAWGHGYATEGARRCLQYAFDTLNIPRVFAACTVQNDRSENVMKKIGMIRKWEFKHPRLKDYPEYEKCIWYEIER